MQNEKKLPFLGASCAVITPFLQNGSIDKESFANIIEHQLMNKTAALTVLGTTGEAPTVSDREHHGLLSLSAKLIKGQIPLIGGCGSNDTHHAVYLAQSAEDAGCDALLVITPYYNKASASGLIRHFYTVAESVSVPIILYNVPQRTGVSIPFDVYKDLSEVENVVAVKDASGDFTMASKIISELDGKLHLYSGNDELTLPLLSVGAKGVISVASNVVPSEMSDLCKLYSDGYTEGARALHQKLLPVFRMLSCEVNPIPIKYAASLLGLCEPIYRLPLCSPTPNNAEYIKNALKAFGFAI